MTPITNPPQGLISLFGLNDMGAVPKLLLNQIQAGIDITEFVLLAREPLINSVNFNAIGNQTIAEAVVPPGQLWYVHAAEARSAICAAGESIALQVCYSQSGINISQGEQANAAAGARCVSFMHEKVWIPPGGTISARVNQITTTGNIAVTISALVTKLRI